MKVTIVGTGNVANVLCRLIISKGHQVIQVIGRNEETLKVMADRYGAKVSILGSPVCSDADICIIAVSDAALEDVLRFIEIEDIPLVHTAGSVSIQVLKNFSSRFGILYPLQTLRKEMHHLPPIPFMVDGNDENTRDLIKTFAKTLSEYVEVADDDRRIETHVAAVFVCNFTNHLYALAENYCQHQSLPFDILRPLIQQTADRVMQHSPYSVQTGPAVRKDMQTIEKHLKMLNSHPDLKSIYIELTESIIRSH